MLPALKASLTPAFSQKYGVKEIYGAHNEPSLDVGTIAFKAGPTMAACDLFSIRVVGVGTHGARPNFGKDPRRLPQKFITLCRA